MSNLYLRLFFLSMCFASITFGLLRIPCPMQNAANFCNLNADNICASGNLQVNGNVNVFGVLSASGINGYGNTLIVDSVDGNDAIGAVNGPRFKTIGAACAQANPGDIIWVFPGIYNESITVPSFVTLQGVSLGNIVITQQNVTQPTDLVTLSTGANISNFTLVLTSQMHVQLRGLVFPPSTLDPEIASSAISIGIFVDNSGAGAGNSNVYAVNFSAPGSTNIDNNGLGQTIAASAIQVNSTGGGKKRGVLVDTENSINILATRVIVAGGSDAICAETDDPNAIIILDGSILDGSTAEISQTRGDLNLLATSLANAQANDLGFDTLVKAANFIFADIDTPIGAYPDPLWMRPGSSEPSAVPITIPASQHFLAKSLTIRAITPPGPGASTTVTVQRQRLIDPMPLDTPLALTLTGMQTEADLQSLSVHFDANDLMAVKVLSSGTGAMTGDLLASINIY